MKQFRKRLFLALACVMLCLGIAPAFFAFRAEAKEELLASGSCGEKASWTLTKSGILTVSGTGPMEDFPVYGAKAKQVWGGHRKQIKKAVIQKGITSLGDNAFRECGQLQSVSLPEGLTEIGDSAFYLCTSLKEVSLPGSVREIGRFAFRECTALRRYLVPKQVSCKEYGLAEVNDGCVVYGYSGTAAETYARDKMLDFQDLSAVKKKKNQVLVFPIAVTASPTKAQTCQVEAEVLDGADLAYRSDHSAVTVSDTGKITVSKGFVGTAKITVRAAETIEYTAASATMKLTVNPSATSLSGVKNEKGRKLAVKWKKNATGSGYQLQYSMDKSFKKKVTTKNIGRNGTTSAIYTGLTKGKNYYVRIRTVKKSGKTTLYSAWSGAKKVKIVK